MKQIYEVYWANEIKMKATNLLSTSKYVAFVEGKTDENFYSNRSEYYLRKSNTKYLAGKWIDEESLEPTGKNYVKDAYKWLSTSEQFQSYSKRLLYIIDRDYDLNLPEGISATPYHSFENYYFIEENIMKLFSHYGWGNPRTFIDLLQSVADKTLEYFLLVETISYIGNKDWYKYKCRQREMKYKICLNPSPSVNIYFEHIGKNNAAEIIYESSWLREVQLIKDKVLKNSKARKHFTELAGVYKAEIGNIRGHNALSFLEEYLHVSGMDKMFKDKMNDFIPELTLGAIFVDINGRDFNI